MRNKELYTEYCTGCGLCGGIPKKVFTEDSKGYPVPDINEEDVDFCQKVCPASGNALSHYQEGSIWGLYSRSYLGWSNDDDIRKDSSSGGVLSSLCIYLLENKMVDGIIQTRESRADIRKAETIVSRTREDILSCMGSRYTSSSPLMNLGDKLVDGETYAFVGKPCDVSSLRIYLEEVNPSLKRQIKYLLSFFCAGQPSIAANNKLIKTLGGENLSECIDLQYRGNGWPGYATLTKADKTKQMMDYETSWMKILGRDVRKICRFCADGTGELADISCGDAWYLGKNGRPDFTERLGRNVVFARTEVGADLMKEVEQAGCLVLESFDPDKDGLQKMQPYHYTRKASLLVYKWALKICGRNYPMYDNKKLRQFAKGFSLKQKVLRFGGTVQRVLQGKI